MTNLPEDSANTWYNSNGAAVGVDAGCLPAWKTADLPEPLPFNFRNAIKTIGPGAILLAGSIGGGEWIVGPMMTVQYGRGILWIATVAIFLQMIFNLEAVRYTLYTGEPILTGIMRLSPGKHAWGAFFTFMGVAQLATPGIALGCANVIFASFMMRLPADSGGDSMTLLWVSYAILAVTMVMLLSGRSIERLLEKLSWLMVVLIFSFLLVANCLFVPLNLWIETAAGFFTPRALPENMDVMLFALFAATAGSGGIGNLAISNWIRDKGFGMGAHVGGFGGLLASEHTELQATGRIFPVTAENMRRWGQWWRYVLADQVGLWAVGCLLGMYLNVNLAAAIVPPGTELSGFAAGAFQAKYMAERLWQGFWTLCLLNGFWVLFSTHVGNTDCLTRTVADMFWAAFPQLRRWRSSQVYAGILAVIVVWGIVTLAMGDNALSLFKILGLFATPVLSISALLILRVNTRFLPAEIRPSLWRRFCLLVCAIFYGVICVAGIRDFLADFS